MFDAVLAFNLVEHLARAAVPGEPAGYNRVLTSHRGPHRTVDGYVALLPYTDRPVAGAVHRRRAGGAARRALVRRSRAARLRNADDVYGALAGIVRERTTAEWLEICEANGVPASPGAQPRRDRRRSRAAHGCHHGGRPSGGRALPADRAGGAVLDDRRSRCGARHRCVAQHTREILAEAGYDDAAVDRLVAEGVVKEAAS